MANLAQINLTPRGRESQIRALLRDVADNHKGIYPQNRLALAVWFHKSPEEQDQYLLELFGGIGAGSYLGPQGGIAETRFSLLWQKGSDGPPFVNLRATSVEYFSRLLETRTDVVAPYRDRFEVLYFDKDLLNGQIIDAFQIVTEPPGLSKGWYISDNEYQRSRNTKALLTAWGHTRPQLGLVKTEESKDFEYCRGLLHVEVEQRWLPLSSEEIRDYTYYNDHQSGQRVYFLFEGGALYEVLKFEVKSAPEYAAMLKLLGKTVHDRYPEVYLRAVHPSPAPAT
jgi:hypothetical protein